MSNVQETQLIDDDEFEEIVVPDINDNYAESSYITLLDLLNEVWDSSFSATRNVRLLIAMISSYMTKSGATRRNTQRMHEGNEMKNTLMDVYSLLIAEGPMDPVCPTLQMQLFLRNTPQKELHARLVKGVMNETSYRAWITDYRQYIKNVSTDLILTALDAKKTCEHFAEVDSPLESAIPQNITKLCNGKLHIVRTPGEVNTQLVRIQIFNVDDIRNMDKRNWWRRAKLRGQFLYSSSTVNTKHRLVQDLITTVTNDLLRVDGVTRETRDLFIDDAQPERKRKRTATATATAGTSCMTHS